MSTSRAEKMTLDEFADPEVELTSVGSALRSGGLVCTLDIGRPMDLMNLAHQDSIGSPALFLEFNGNNQHYLHLAREDGKAFDLLSLDLAKFTADDTVIPTVRVMAYRDVSQNPVVTQCVSLIGTSRVQNLVLNGMTDVTYIRMEVIHSVGVLVDAISYDKKDQMPVQPFKMGFHYIYPSGNEADLDCYPLILGREYRVESSSDLITWSGSTAMAYQPHMVLYTRWQPDASRRRFFRLSWQELTP